MLCTVVVVFTLTGLCRGNSDNSSQLPQLPPPPTVSRRMSQAEVASLRRQLMRDNYDYQHSGDDRTQQNVTETNIDDAAKFYNPQSGADHLQRASELDQANVNSFSVELDQQDQYVEQDRQRQQGGKHDQPVIYEQRRRRGPAHPHEQLGNSENRGQSDQPTEHEQPDQYDQQGPRQQQHQLQQQGQNEQLGKYKHRGLNTQPREPEQGGQYEQRGQLEQPGRHKHRYQYKPSYQNKQREQLEQRGQLEHRNQDLERGSLEQRGQNAKLRRHREFGMDLESRQSDQREIGEPQEQLGQFDEQEPSMERTDRAAPPLADAPRAPSDEPTVRDVRDREYPPARHAAHPDWPVEDYNKRRDTYGPEPMQRRPFGDLRSSYPEKPFPRADAANDQREQKERAMEKDAQSPEQNPSPDEREAFDRQAFERLEMSGSENEGSDISESQKQPDARYDEVRPQGSQYSKVTRSTRANRLQYYTLPPTRRAPPPQYDRMPNAPPPQHDRMRNAPPPQHDRMRNAPPPQHDRMRNAPPYHHRDTPLGRHHSAPRDHNNSRAGPNGLRVNPAGFQASPTAAGSLHNTTGIHPNSAGSRHSTVSARPSPVGIRTSPISSRVGPYGPRVNRAGSQASPAGSRLRPDGSWSSLASTHSKPPRHAGSTGPPDLPRTERARSFVVTVSPNNVTYKLWTLKSREGRRRVERRLLEERGPGGLAIVSLDHAPLPVFRMPRARRQYMHNHHHHHHKPA